MVVNNNGEISEENLVMENFRYNKIEILIRECTIKIRAAIIPPTIKKITFPLDTSMVISQQIYHQRLKKEKSPPKTNI